MNSIVVKEASRRLHNLGNKTDAQFLQRFFKTGPGQYGEGDIFLGIRVPVLRKLAKEYKNLTPEEVLSILHSPYHEERLFALIILVNAFAIGNDALQKQIYNLYLDNTNHINNWDLVDISAPNIVGAFLTERRSRNPLCQLAKSNSLWERRIAMLATFYFIKRNQFSDALAIAASLLRDQEDLIQKAAGWMLREIGKRDIKILEPFLKKHCKVMPRTMLRYAIEKMPESRRRMYLDGSV